MIQARQVAKYFLYQDKNSIMFVKNIIERNGHWLYSGNVRLNIYLQFAQNLYITKTGTKLFEDDLYAYDYGVVVPAVVQDFSGILEAYINTSFSPEITDFLDRVYKMLQNASLQELIDISLEDPAWKDKKDKNSMDRQKIDSLAYVQKYKEQYHDALRTLEQMEM